MPGDVELTLAPPTVITQEQVDDIGRSQRLLPTEDQFIGRPGYERKYRADGSYEWKYSYEQNDGRGRLTKEGEEASEMLRPFQVAEEERTSRRPRPGVVAMRDADGKTQYVDPAMADNAAKRNGWGHQPYAGKRRRRVLKIVGGRLYRLVDGQWVEER